MKGIISMLEMIAVVIILFITFSIFFPGFSYTNKWNEATLLLKSRDIILTIDRLDLLYNYSFNSADLQGFLSTVVPQRNIITWSETQGTIKSTVRIACNCSTQQIGDLISWFGELKINNRTIDMDVFPTNLETINQPADVLLIWEYKPLGSYKNRLLNFIGDGNGIVEIMDFKYQGKDEDNIVDSDPVQTEIFGLKWIDVEKRTADTTVFTRKPDNSTDIIYGPYKYFYHVPLPVRVTTTVPAIGGCLFSPSPTGNLTLNTTKYQFWICDQTSVWFDTDGDFVNDQLVNERETVVMGGFNFYLSYIKNDTKIGLSFKSDYHFEDFLWYIKPEGEPDPPGEGWGIYRIYHIEPGDDNTDRILLKSISESPPREYPVVILNQSTIVRTAWIANFTDIGTSDDEKLLLTSLLLWASNKRTREVVLGDLQFGYLTSYLNTVNDDMFEVYRFNLGLGFPY